jgi:hypothetical protein
MNRFLLGAVVVLVLILVGRCAPSPDNVDPSSPSARCWTLDSGTWCE